MCIIAAKPAGVSMPSRETIRTMFENNPDGAGFMFVENNKVHIEKGFMKYKSFAKALDKLENRLDMTKTPLIMHFRITTHGGTSPENCHPFPITDSIGALKKTSSHTDIGVAHNGIISITPRKGISDTMEYIASQLAPLKRAMPRFYENRHAMTLIQNAITSKMAFLTKEGKVYTTGDFVEDNGMLYSNHSYQKSYGYYRNIGKWNMNCYGGWDDYADSRDPFFADGDNECLMSLCWLDESDYMKDSKGNLREGLDFLIGSDGTLYEYDYELDLAIEARGLSAFTKAGTTKRYDEFTAEPIMVDIGSEILY